MSTVLYVWRMTTPFHMWNYTQDRVIRLTLFIFKTFALVMSIHERQGISNAPLQFTL